jgi:hypothetical protein
LNAEENDDEGLDKFFNILERYNGYQPIKQQIKDEILEYFDHRWDFHKNTFLYEKDEYKGFMSQIPDDIKDDLISKFLFGDFVKTFRKQFGMMKPHDNIDRIKFARYTRGDDDYSIFMDSILSSLEPIQYKRYEILLDELDDVN